MPFHGRLIISYLFAQTVRKWCAALRRELALRRRRLSEEEGDDACTSRPLDRRRNMLVFVNPKSGAGKAGKIYEEVLAPALRQAGIQHDLVFRKQNRNISIRFGYTKHDFLI